MMKESPARSRISSLLALSLGVALPCASMAGEIVLFSSGTVTENICGNGISGGLGSGRCGSSSVLNQGQLPDAFSVDFSPEALTGNHVTLSGSTNVLYDLLSGRVYGAYANESGDVRIQGNIVTIDITGAPIRNDGHHMQGAYGAEAWSVSGSAQVINNRLELLNGSVGSVYAGRAESESGPINADGNTLTMSGGSAHLLAGVSVTGRQAMTATNNSAYLSGNATVSGYAYGADVYHHDTLSDGDMLVENNRLEIFDNARVGVDAIGALASKYDYYGVLRVVTVTNNTTRIYGNAQVGRDAFSGSAYTYRVYGSGPLSARVAFNTLEVYDNARIGGSAYGGHGRDGSSGTGVIEVIGNTAKIYGNATVEKDFDGGAANTDTTQPLLLRENTAELSGNARIGEHLIGGLAQSLPLGSGSAAAINNVVKMSGGEVWVSVSGGVVWTSGIGEVRNNTVTVSGGIVGRNGGNVYGGRLRNYIANSSDLFVEGNTVIFSGNAKTLARSSGLGSLYGGYINAFSPIAAANLSISNNTVIVRDHAEVAGNIFGGMLDINTPRTLMATGNTVTIEGTPVFSASTGLYGGYCANCTADSDLYSGNTLNFKSSGLSVASVRNFELLNFTLPSGTQAGDILLTVTGTAELSDGVGRSPTVTINPAGASLKPGDSVILIDAGSLNGTPNDKYSAQDILKYDFDILTTPSQLIATLADVNASEESKSLSEGYLAGSAFINQGSDFLTGKGLKSAQSAAQVALQSGQFRPQHFGSFGGGQIRHKSGSHVDVRGYNLVAGTAVGFRPQSGEATLSFFFEYGEGDYSTYNSFASGKVRGKGDTRYKGAGLMGRFEFNNALYVEGSFRGGQSESEYRSDDLRDASGTRAEYDAKNGYIGAHIGVGRFWKLGEKNTLDTYAKFLWAHQGKDAVTLSTGDRIKFDPVSSERLRLGARIHHALLGHLFLYSGAAYEYEFASKAKATVNGYGIDAPELRGSTGMLEVGLSLLPMEKRGFIVDLGVQGYAGKREGVMTTLRAEYKF